MLLVRSVVKLTTAIPLMLSFVLAPLSAPQLGGVWANDTETLQLAAINPKLVLPHRLALGALGLSDEDALTYRRIFQMQEVGNWATADRLIDRLGDERLMGHVLYQRYMHPTAYRSSYTELRDWLRSYADHPGAHRIHRLALRRQPAGVAAPRAPTVGRPIAEGNVEAFEFVRPPLLERAAMSPAARARSADHVRRLRDWVRQDVLTRSVTYIDRHRDEIDLYDQHKLFADIAERYFRLGSYNEQARAAAQRLLDADGPEQFPGGLFYGGLASWRLGDFEQAMVFFERLTQSRWALPRERAAGAYWSARTALKLRRLDTVSGYLAQAAMYPHTLYGLIATRWLGLKPRFGWQPPALSSAEIAALGRHPAGQRAVALLQAGQRQLAEDELIRLDPKGDPLVVAAMVAVADIANLSGLALRLGSTFTRPDGGYYDNVLYPVPSWEPQTGYLTDRALVFAFMKQESRFQVHARSHAGAIGLMQVMPRTARYIARRSSLPSDTVANLRDPVNNVTLGDAYLQYLLGMRGINGDLIRLAAAYNGGPGNLARWSARIDTDDPLLFIELIPSWETRRHVKRVLSNFWLYRLRLGQDPVSLDQMMQDEWPVYVPLDAAKQLRLPPPRPFIARG